METSGSDSSEVGAERAESVDQLLLSLEGISPRFMAEARELAVDIQEHCQTIAEHQATMGSRHPGADGLRGRRLIDMRNFSNADDLISPRCLLGMADVRQIHAAARLAQEKVSLLQRLFSLQSRQKDEEFMAVEGIGSYPGGREILGR